MNSKLLVFAATSMTLTLVLAKSSPATAARPLVRTALAIRNLEKSMPMPLDQVSKKEFLGLDRDEEKTQKRVIREANDYVALKSGKRGRGAFSKWVETCDAKTGTADENAFCRIEQDKKRQVTALRAPQPSRDEKTSVAAALRDGRFEVANGASTAVLNAAIRLLDTSGDLSQVAARLSESSNCHAPALSYLVAYKLEEQFPAELAVETARKIYRRGSDCGSPGELYAAQSSFRYGLMQIWKKECKEIPSLMAKVEASADASNFHPRARFWRYYCASQSNDSEAKSAARESLAKNHPLSFQNLAVAGDDPAALAEILRASPPSAAVRSLVRTEMNPLVRGVEALLRVGATQIAADVVDRNIADISSLEPEVRLYLAILMNRIGYALPKFKILNTLFADNPQFVSVDTMRLFFPLWYADVVRKQVRHVDPLLIISLIRQESAFNKEARSGVGARGLMQVMPATARMVASVRTPKLYDPETNIGIGTKYFVQRLQQYDGDVELTLAAYNAGFSRVDQWKKRYPTDNRMLFLDFIPFRETRDYVSSILRNYYWYVKLYNQEMTTASSEGGPKVNVADVKVQAIMNAMAGTAATETDKQTP